MTDAPIQPSAADALRTRARRCRSQAETFESEFGPKLRELAEELEKEAKRLDARAAMPANPLPKAGDEGHDLHSAQPPPT